MKIDDTLTGSKKLSVPGSLQKSLSYLSRARYQRLANSTS